MEQSFEPVSTEYWSARKLEGTSIRIRKVENSTVNRQTDRQTDRDRLTDRPKARQERQINRKIKTSRELDGHEDRQFARGRANEQTSNPTHRMTTFPFLVKEKLTL